MKVFGKEGKSAINLSHLRNFAEFDSELFIYVRLFGSGENYLC